MRFVPSLFVRRHRGAVGRFVERMGYAHRMRRFDRSRLTVAGRLMQAGWHAIAALLTTHAERELLAEYLGADLVLASGGTYLVPAYDMESPLLDYELTVALGRPFGVMSQSLGPFIGSPLRERFRRIGLATRVLFVRDETSRKHLREIGVAEERITVMPDCAFALRDPAHRPPTDAPRRVAVSVREWRHFSDGSGQEGERRYLAGIAGLVTWLVRDAGAHVTFLSSCQGIPDYWADDSRTAREVVALLNADVAANVAVDSQFRNPKALQQVLSTFDLVVATRMHVAILAMCTARPVLAVAYEFKTTELFASIGLDWLAVPIEAAEAPQLIAVATRLLSEWEAVGTQLYAGVGALATRLEPSAAALRAAADPVTDNRNLACA
jgi:colanic acid/amylovoran biosynthesis protein